VIEAYEHRDGVRSASAGIYMGGHSGRCQAISRLLRSVLHSSVGPLVVHMQASCRPTSVADRACGHNLDTLRVPMRSGVVKWTGIAEGKSIKPDKASHCLWSSLEII